MIKIVKNLLRKIFIRKPKYYQTEVQRCKELHTPHNDSELSNKVKAVKQFSEIEVRNYEDLRSKDTDTSPLKEGALIRLRELRKVKRISIKKMSAELGISREVYKSIERGEYASFLPFIIFPASNILHSVPYTWFKDGLSKNEINVYYHYKLIKTADYNRLLKSLDSLSLVDCPWLK